MSLDPANVEVIFRIFDSSVPDGLDTGILQRDHVKRWSLGFKELMKNEDSNRVVSIELKPGSGVDSTSVVWVLNNFQQKLFNVVPDPKTFARYCAVLWKFECIPDSFEDLGESTHTPRSTLNSLSDVDPKASTNPSTSHSASGNSRCWQGRSKNRSCSELMVIAIVLGLKQKLVDAIETAMWGSSRKIDITTLCEIKLNVDFEKERKIELGQLFNTVFIKIHEIQEENDKRSIRETLEQCGLGDFSKGWESSAKNFNEWTPSVFLQAIENALRPPEPQTRQYVSPTVVGFKELQELQPADWVNAFKKAKQATKHALHIGRGKEIVGEQQSAAEQEKKNAILKSLEDYIGQRQEGIEKIAVDLIDQRNLIVQRWKDKLVE